MFVVLETDGIQHCEQLLSTRFMQWVDRTFVYDLRPCYSYWQLQAGREQCSVAQVIASFIQLALADYAYRAVMVWHPWQGVLLLQHMQEQDMYGFVERDSANGLDLYRHITWNSWWLCVDRLSELWLQDKPRGFQLANFKQRCRQMRQASQRLGVARPGDLIVVGSQAIGRRYGAFLKMIWEWSYTEFPHAILLEGFPWQQQAINIDYVVCRNLDFSLPDWAHIEPLLREDFDRLCELMTKYGAESRRVVCLQWRLIFEDTSVCEIPIRFRHPHLLQREQGTHSTVLMQAYYSFQSFMTEYVRQGEDEGIAYTRAIIRWELEIAESLTIAASAKSLFSQDAESEEAVLELENKLHVPLLKFDIENDWSIEGSFSICTPDQVVRNDNENNSAFKSMSALAQVRPLFIYKSDFPLQKRYSSRLWRFCERTMTKWWTPKGECSFRDYYCYVDEERRALWVTRHPDKKWYVCGIFA